MGVTLRLTDKEAKDCDCLENSDDDDEPFSSDDIIDSYTTCPFHCDKSHLEEKLTEASKDLLGHAKCEFRTAYKYKLLTSGWGIISDHVDLKEIKAAIEELEPYLQHAKYDAYLEQKKEFDEKQQKLEKEFPLLKLKFGACNMLKPEGKRKVSEEDEANLMTLYNFLNECVKLGFTFFISR